MSGAVTVVELLVLEPLTDFRILAGWKGRFNRVEKIYAGVPEAGRGTLVVLPWHPRETERTIVSIREALKLPAAAVFLTGKNVVPALPRELIAQCDNAQIPVVHLPWSNGWEQIEAVWRLVAYLKEQRMFYLFLQNAGSHFVRLVTREGLVGLVCYLEKVVNSPLAVITPAFELICSGEQKFVPSTEEFVRLVRQAYYTRGNCLKGSTRGKSSVHVEPAVITLQEACGKETIASLFKLQAGNKLYGYLVVQTVTGLNELEIALMKQAGPVITSELLKYDEILEVERKYQDNFIYDLLHNNFTSYEAIIKQGKIWGWDFTKPRQIMVMEIHGGLGREELSFEHLKLLISGVAATVFKESIISELDEKIVVIVPAEKSQMQKERKAEIKRLAQLIKQRLTECFPESSFYCGIGRFYPSVMDLCRCYQEAKTAMELGRFLKHKEAITHFEELGVMRLLAGVSYEQLDDFCQEYLGDLIAYDEKNNSNLMETLETYLQESGDINKTSGRLYVHPNTLRHRIKKIEEILGLSLETYENLVNLFTALKIYIMRQHVFGNKLD